MSKWGKAPKNIHQNFHTMTKTSPSLSNLSISSNCQFCRIRETCQICLLCQFLSNLSSLSVLPVCSCTPFTCSMSKNLAFFFRGKPGPPIWYPCNRKWCERLQYIAAAAAAAGGGRKLILVLFILPTPPQLQKRFSKVGHAIKTAKILLIFKHGGFIQFKHFLVCQKYFIV